MNDKPFSQACENNKLPILEVIRTVYTEAVTVWEIGSGTGQHGLYFAGQLPHLCWQPTDLQANHSGINQWREEGQLPNLKEPVLLDVTEPVWPCASIDALFTANTLHILSWDAVVIMFQRLGHYLNPSALVCIYGPFNYQGRYTSDSNAAFDLWLKNRDCLSGIRDFEAVLSLAEQHGLTLLSDHPMPANNRLLVLQKLKAFN